MHSFVYGKREDCPRNSGISSPRVCFQPLLFGVMVNTKRSSVVSVFLCLLALRPKCCPVWDFLQVSIICLCPSVFKQCRSAVGDSALRCSVFLSTPVFGTSRPRPFSLYFWPGRELGPSLCFCSFFGLPVSFVAKFILSYCLIIVYLYIK